jgi:hypothetical protein
MRWKKKRTSKTFSLQELPIDSVILAMYEAEFSLHLDNSS